MPKKQASPVGQTRPREKLVIIDSNALLHRAWHAVPPLQTKDGTVVNAVFGYTSLLLNIIKDLDPKYIVACFDLKGKTFRHEAYAAYKAQRVKQADEFYNQIPLAHEVVKAFNIPILTKEGFEADDMIGTLAKAAFVKHADLEIIIITGDLDALQLVNKRVKVLTLKHGFNDTIIYDEDAVLARYGLKPRQLIDMKALSGDSSDNIKGVPGIGEKGASDLIKQFDSLENIYKHLSQVPKERTQNLLTEYKDQAFQSKKLVTIVTDADIKWDIEAAKFSDFDPQAVYDIFQKLEFRTLVPRIPRGKAEQKPLDFGPQKDIDYQIIDSISHFNSFLKMLKAQPEFAVDTETTGLNVLQDDILGISFAWQKQTGYFINLRNKELRETALLKLKPILEDKTKHKIGHNIKFDYKVFRQLGINLQGIYFDTLLAAYLINPSRGLRLEELAFSYLGYKKLRLSDLVEDVKLKKNIDVSSIPLSKLGWYASEDADITLRLYHKLLSIIKENKNFELLQDIELPLISVLADMELTGISLDQKFLAIMEKKFDADIKKLTHKIYDLAGSEFNIASTQQLKKVLFENLAISTLKIKKNKTGLSTAASELDKLIDAHPIIPLLIEYRELAKLQSTYIRALPELVDPTTHRLHTSYNQAVTTTGRLSSTDPNLQNIPIRSALGREIRKAFVTPKDHVLLSADYSQIELRLAASISGDPKMIASFKAGEDIHARTAAEIHKIPLDQVTKDIRRTAKEVNFGVLYGLGSLGLAQRTGLTRQEAKDFIARYFDIYKKVKDYINHTQSFAAKHGFVATLFGRRRYLPDIHSHMPMLRASAERMAINMPLQGTAADLMKLAMVKLHAGLPKVSQQTKIVLQVHDELVLEVPSADLDKVAKFVKNTMENVHKIAVPLTVDLEVGQTWGDLQKI